FNPSLLSLNTSYYYAVVKIGGAPRGCDSVLSATTQQIDVFLQPSITSATLTGAIYCMGDATSLLNVTANSNNANNPSFQWYGSTVQNIIGNIISGQTLNTYLPVSNSLGTNYYSVVIGNGTCFTTSSQSGAIVVNSLPTINTQPIGGQSYCTGTTPTILNVAAFSSDGAGLQNLTYQWFYNSTNSYNNAIRIDNATGSSYSPKDTIAQRYYFVTVRNNFVGNSCSINTTITNPIAFYSVPVISKQPDLNISNYCQATNSVTNTPLTVVANNGGLGNNLQIVWYVSLSNSATGNDSVGVGASFSPSIANFGRTYYFVRVINLDAPL
ncbi:MAG: hypothetical protein ORN85_06770, partial [Sediminibacterium sp.]|nr:hypothetical protein [Sediminibacterium sp.]